jgi:predicted transcriptional regulator
MKLSEIKNSEVVIFRSQDGQTEFQVVLDGEHDTVWVTEQQIMELFGKARRTVEYHIKNIYEEGELDRVTTWREFRQVQKEGEREVSRKISVYNLDVIISVGYRVKSQVGTEFRKWATQRLKEYLLRGYSVNKELLIKEQDRVSALQKELSVLYEEFYETQKVLTDGILSIISYYSKSFELLEKYDKDNLSSENLNKDVIQIINYDDVKKAIQRLKSDLVRKGEASDLFGNERDD